MIIITNGNGDIQAPTIPENVYQGSNKANGIVFMNPLPQSNSVKIAFRLANGLLTEPALMTPYTSVPSQYNLNAWVCDINEDITAYYGKVEYQVQMTATDGKVLANVMGTFNVLRGVAPILPATPTQDIYEDILTALANINADLENGWVVAKGLLPYDDEFTYPYNVNVYDKTTSAIYTSLVDDNLGNPLTDTTKWSKTAFLTQGDIDSRIAIHNVSSTAHQDIRNALITLDNKVDTFDSRISSAESNASTALTTATNAYNAVSGKVDKQVRVDSANGYELGKITNTKDNVTIESEEAFGNVDDKTKIEATPNKVELTAQHSTRSGAETTTTTKKITLTSTSAKIDNQEITTDNKLALKQDKTDNSLVTSLKTIVGAINEIAQQSGTTAQQVATILGLIPAQASTSNQLADKNFVNSTVNSLAAFYITKNAAGDPFETYTELVNTSPYYSGGEVRVPSRNDYALVRTDSLHQDATTRYIYNNGWEFQFVVNETPLTAAQLAALNSGITSSLVAEFNNKVTRTYVTTAGRTLTLDNDGFDFGLHFDEDGEIDKTIFISSEGMEFIDNLEHDYFRPQINGTEEMAYLSDLDPITDKTDIIKTDGTGNKYLANDGTYKEVQSAPDVDDITITKNDDNELQAIGLTDGTSNLTFAQIYQAITIRRRT